MSVCVLAPSDSKRTTITVYEHIAHNIAHVTIRVSATDGAA